MRIVHIAAEMAPFIKVGGLGDMVGGLTVELAKRNHDVELILPAYSFINLPPCHKNVKITPIQLSEHPSYFKRPNVYGYEDDAARFMLFCKEAARYLHNRSEKIDILHIHDWHTGICAAFSKTLTLNTKKIVLNIHNLQYQGICNYSALQEINLPLAPHKNIFQKKLFKTPKINLLKIGIDYADAIVVVSPNYAKEILTKKFSCGLLSTLLENKHKITGILNGISFTDWNPQIDPDLACHYSNNDSIKKILEAKNENKLLLQKQLGLCLCNKPLVAYIGRLVEQKGPELILESINTTLKNNAQFVLLGSSLIKTIQKMFSKAKQQYKNDNNVSINFDYDETLSRLIYAAGDFLIMPSLFEPCGLTQMIALRYGTLPIARKTGGLADTVFDINDNFAILKNGFTFEKFTKKECSKTITRALSYKHKSPEQLYPLIENAINMQLSLDKTAKDYEDLYKKLLSS